MCISAVVFYAGDAVISIFTNHPNNKQCTHIARALLCAVQLKSICSHGLVAHVGIGYGSYTLTTLGGHKHHWTQVISGECVNVACRCLREASGGTAVSINNLLSSSDTSNDPHSSLLSVFNWKRLTSGSYELLGVKENLCAEVMYDLFVSPQFDSLPHRKSHLPRLRQGDSDPQILNLLQSFMQPGIVNALAEVSMGSVTVNNNEISCCDEMLTCCCGSGDMVFPIEVTELDDEKFQIPEHSCIAQHMSNLFTREIPGAVCDISALFVCIEDYDINNIEIMSTGGLEHLQPVYLAMQEAVEDSNGLLRQFVVDDKGCVLVALWGTGMGWEGHSIEVPDHGHIIAAVRCAFRICSAAKLLHHSVSVAVSTGSAYCGRVGSPSRREYGAIGDAVNRCARMVHTSYTPSDSVVIDRPTYTGLLQLLDLNSLDLKDEVFRVDSQFSNYNSIDEVYILHTPECGPSKCTSIIESLFSTLGKSIYSTENLLDAPNCKNCVTPLSFRRPKEHSSRTTAWTMSDDESDNQ
eukprot:CAMPEP_0185040842 /NCGR_PEP_ID=MMETSP1103-20130426/39396_1 /TAXON_ID=36769 /ORGANISM="Paraphysomonas bandaiensis, Strain Caron Lab Isolate" /LENGTH=521 /DNA_ID=CAMNT_0027580309 /DNA_START=282 /DNA_END=1847 /DNA_ORIENTATION=+